MKHILEINKYHKDQIEIIYQDSNLLCMIPKTQYVSKLYGGDSDWCQKTVSGFYGWSKGNNGINLLIRFIFKDKRKIRLTIELNKKGDIHDFHWANENGIHIFYDNRLEDRHNPFYFLNNPYSLNYRKYDEMSPNEQKLYNAAKNIPQKCIDNIFEYIRNKKNPNYVYSDDDATLEKERRNRKNINYLINKYKHNQSKYFSVSFIMTKKYNINYVIDYTDYLGKEVYINKISNNINDIIKIIDNIIKNTNILDPKF